MLGRVLPTLSLRVGEETDRLRLSPPLASSRLLSPTHALLYCTTNIVHCSTSVKFTAPSPFALPYVNSLLYHGMRARKHTIAPHVTTLYNVPLKTDEEETNGFPCAILEFVLSNKDKLDFPSSLSSFERLTIHRIAEEVSFPCPLIPIFRAMCVSARSSLTHTHTHTHTHDVTRKSDIGCIRDDTVRTRGAVSRSKVGIIYTQSMHFPLRDERGGDS